MSDSFVVTSTVKVYPKAPYKKIKESILGQSYNLTLNFIGQKRARKVNQLYRQADYVPNVLSFPLNQELGEVYICPEVAKREATKFSLSYNGYVSYLFIHGCLHLKGYDHGATMDKLEQYYKRKFKVA